MLLQMVVSGLGQMRTNKWDRCGHDNTDRPLRAGPTLYRAPKALANPTQRGRIAYAVIVLRPRRWRFNTFQEIP